MILVLPKPPSPAKGPDRRQVFLGTAAVVGTVGAMAYWGRDGHRGESFFGENYLKKLNQITKENLAATPARADESNEVWKNRICPKSSYVKLRQKLAMEYERRYPKREKAVKELDLTIFIESLRARAIKASDFEENFPDEKLLTAFFNKLGPYKFKNIAKREGYTLFEYYAVDATSGYFGD